MFAGLFIIANFTAGVTTRLTVQQIQGVINGPQDLSGKVVVTVEDSTADTWLTENRIPHRTVESWWTRRTRCLKRMNVQAVVYDFPVLRYYALKFGRRPRRGRGSPVQPRRLRHCASPHWQPKR